MCVKRTTTLRGLPPKSRTITDGRHSALFFRLLVGWLIVRSLCCYRSVVLSVQRNSTRENTSSRMASLQVYWGVAGRSGRTRHHTESAAVVQSLSGPGLMRVKQSLVEGSDLSITWNDVTQLTFAWVRSHFSHVLAEKLVAQAQWSQP